MCNFQLEDTKNDDAIAFILGHEVRNKALNVLLVEVLLDVRIIPATHTRLFMFISYFSILVLIVIIFIIFVLIIFLLTNIISNKFL